MSLYTKSIQAKKIKSDGIRICVMRRPDKDADFDIWMPHLSPSNKLLDDYQQGKIDWDGYVVRFNREVIKKETKYFKILAELANKKKITILCWEKTPEKCHRRLVAEEIKKRFPALKVVAR